MNLAFKNPVIYWNCACLISDSGAAVMEEEEEIVDIYEEEDEDAEYEDLPDRSGKKKKTRSVDYGKIATAIGQMQSNGITISPPDINKSSYTFVPDVENNKIIYGIKGITKIGDELVEAIIKNRPYEDIYDFQRKVKVNKTQMVNLIKSGAFDSFGNRVEIMYDYITSIADTKTTLNLRNMQKIIEYGLVPEAYDLEKRIFNFNKYLKKLKINEDYFKLDERALVFYEKNFDVDMLIYKDNKPYLSVSYWKKVYSKRMDVFRNWIKDNLPELLKAFNDKATELVFNKYAEGTISKWEMDSVSFYYHEHELAHLREDVYNIDNFFELKEQPEIETTIFIKEKPVPIFKLNRIAGTILDKDKNHNLITVLTNYGVVKVKIYKPQFTKYDKQISVKGEDGKKHVIEKSWFSRGNKIMIVGIRRDDCFVPKIYKNSPYDTPFYLIDKIDDDGYVSGRAERVEI